jgi:D-inositol-3-phosphate glycosyltransferase
VPTPDPARPPDGHHRRSEGRLRGSLDAPAPGDHLTGRSIVVRGWHDWDGVPALAIAVRVELDGASRTTVVPTGTEPRPDVAQAFGQPSLAGAGWSAMVDLPEAAPSAGAQVAGPPSDAGPSGSPAPGGDPTAYGRQPAAAAVGPVELPPVAVIVSPGTSEPSGTIDLGMARDVAAEPAPRHPVAHLDRPDVEVLERRVTKFEGWALFGAAPADRVDVFLNGDLVGRARLGMDRLDVALRWTSPYALISGFEFLLDLPSISPRTRWAHVLVRAHGPEGARLVSERWYEIEPAVEPAERGPRRALLESRHERSLVRVRSAAAAVDLLNLAVFAHSLEVGGAQLWLSELLRLTGAGDRYRCTVIAPGNGPLLGRFEAQGVEVHVSAEPPWHDIEAYDGRVAELALFLVAGGYDAVLANTVRCAGGADAGLRAGLPVAWKIHESWRPRAIWPTFFHPGTVDRAVERRFEEVVGSVGAMVFSAGSTRALYDGLSGRTVVVPWGVDVAALDEYASKVSRVGARASLGLPPGGRLVLVMGTTEPRKAQTLVASALVEVLGRRPDVTVALVGEIPTPYSSALRAFVGQPALQGRVLLVPFVDEATAWYRASDLLLCASDVECMPRTVLEAMAFGLPVVSTDVFGVGELLTDGETGYLYPPNDRGALISSLERVLDEDPATLARVAARARRLVEQHAGALAYSEDMLTLLRGLRADPDSTPAEIFAAAGRDPASRLRAVRA